MLLGTLGASLLERLLTGKQNCKSWSRNCKRGEGIKKKGFMPPHPLTNFEIRKYYENEPRFNGAYSTDDLQKTIKNGAYVINLDEYADVGTHWTASYSKNNEVVYFDRFGGEHVPKEIERFIGDKDIKRNIFRIQAYNSIMCGYFCIGFNDFMCANKFISLFSPYEFEKNDKIIRDYFKCVSFLIN